MALAWNLYSHRWRSHRSVSRGLQAVRNLWLSAGGDLSPCRAIRAQAGAELALDLFDLTQSRVLASSAPLTAPTADWRFLSVMGQVPTGGAVQVRINSTGTLTAVVDDTALAPQ